MIVVMERGATEARVADVVERLAAAGCRVHRMDADRVTLGTTGGSPDADAVGALPGVAAALDDAAAPLVEKPAAGGVAAAGGNGASAADDGAPRGFDVGGHRIGAGEPFLIAGPCSVEDPDTMEAIASGVAAAGAAALRAGAFKPRSSPYSFQGAGEEGLVVLRRAADAHGLLVVSEVMDATHIPVASRYCDVLQVGARNMYNTPLLRELGRARKPVLLKRGLSATIDEWLNAAEYVVSAGNPRVVLCERGIRTFETATRNTLDINAVAVVRERSRLPILVDPSHATGRREYVRAMARAAIAAGADGLMVEAHVDPERATSDARQTIDLEELGRLAVDMRALAEMGAPA